MERLGVELDPALLERALTHRSYAYENGGLPTNERLEFLGDSVLGARRHRHPVPHATPTCPRASWPSCAPPWSTCAALAEVGARARARRLPPAGQGRGDAPAAATSPPSSPTRVEARDRRGLPRPRSRRRRPTLVHRLFDPLIDGSAELGAGPGLEDLAAGAHRRRAGSACPSTSVEESGPDHEKTFAAARAGRRRARTATGAGAARRRPSRQAAEAAWRRARGRSRHGRRRRSADLTRPPGRIACPSCPRSRSSGAACERWVAGPDRRRGRGAAPARGAAAPGGRARLRAPCWSAARRGVRAAAASTSGCPLDDRTSAPGRAPRHERPAARAAARRRPTRSTCASGSRFADGGRELRFVDQRTFGGLALDDLVPDDAEGRVPATVAHIARDPLDPLFDDAAFVRRPAPPAHRDQAGAARPDADLGHRQHLRRRGAVAGAAALGAAHRRARARPGRASCSGTCAT